MNLRRIFAVTKRVFKDIKNDRRTIGLILIAPIFAMFVFGLAFSGNVEDIPVVVVNHDKGLQAPNGENIFLSDKILSNLDNETLKIEYMDDEDKAISKVKDGDAYAVIIFPENFTKNAYLGIGNLSPSSMHTLSFPPQAQITIKDDESITTIKNSIIGAVQDAITKTMEEDGMNFPVKVTQDAIYAKDAIL